jgi:hypothetical protein
METEMDLNSKILKITRIIKDKYPELTKYLTEMQIMLRNEENPQETLKNLQAHYDSLHSNTR